MQLFVCKLSAAVGAEQSECGGEPAASDEEGSRTSSLRALDLLASGHRHEEMMCEGLLLRHVYLQ